MAKRSKGKNRGFVTLECTNCKSRNYRTQKRLRNTEKLELKKYCRVCNKHTLHKERKK